MWIKIFYYQNSYLLQWVTTSTICGSIPILQIYQNRYKSLRMKRSPYSPSPKGDATRSLLPRSGTGILRQAFPLAQPLVEKGSAMKQSQSTDVAIALLHCVPYPTARLRLRNDKLCFYTFGMLPNLHFLV